jgi:hypothetical protein
MEDGLIGMEEDFFRIFGGGGEARNKRTKTTIIIIINEDNYTPCF